MVTLRALNPEAAQRRAYAEAQVKITVSGKVGIGAEFLAELQQDFTQDQIDRGLLQAPKYMNGNPEANMKAIRTACAWIRDADRKNAGAKRPAQGVVRNGRRSF
jgi:hypothetical protein